MQQANDLAIAKDGGESRLYRKVVYRIIPFIFVCYVLNYIDRVNVSFAKLQFRALRICSARICRACCGGAARRSRAARLSVWLCVCSCLWRLRTHVINAAEKRGSVLIPRPAVLHGRPNNVRLRTEKPRSRLQGPIMA